MVPRVLDRGTLRRLVALLAVVLLLGVGAGRAHAHELGLSRGDYLVESPAAGETVVRATLAFARRDAISLLPALDADRDGALTEAELVAGGGQLAARVLEGVVVTAGGAAAFIRLGTPCALISSW